MAAAEAIDEAQAEADPTTFDHGQATSRLSVIYALKRNVEIAEAMHIAATEARKAAKEHLDAARAELENELREQRFGPGPLFGPDGAGHPEKP